MMAMSIRPAFSPPAGCGMHFLKKPATTMASYTGLVARNRSSAVGSNSAALAPASTSVANRRDSSWSSLCFGVSVKSMAMETFPDLIGPVYSVNRYRIGEGKSRMLAPDFLAYGALDGVDSKDSLLGANQIQGCFLGGSLGCDGPVGFERRGVGADGTADH